MPSPFTYFEILRRNPAHFWRMNVQNGGVFGSGVGDSGWDCQSMNLVGGVGQILNAENPMAVAEPFTSAVDFGTAIQTGRFARPNTDGGTMDDYTIGTTIAFFKISSESLTFQFIYIQQNVGGATNISLRIRGDLDNQTMDFDCRNNAADVYGSLIDLGAEIAVAPDWHMVAIRQAADGQGVLWFFDGNFFDRFDAEVTESFAGTFGRDVWAADTLGGPAPSTIRGIGANAANGSSGINGLIFNVVNDNKVWTDEELTAVWNQALANGLDVA